MTTEARKTLKRNTRVTYTYAAGKIVQGKILGPYAKDMPEWFRVELTDEYGTTQGGCHIGQLKIVDNR